MAEFSLVLKKGAFDAVNEGALRKNLEIFHLYPLSVI
jgi:hypothetical protein